jgi:hypothetical protein
VNTNAASNLPPNPEIGATGFGPTASSVTMTAAIEPTLPNELVGQPVSLVGVNACYNNNQTTLTSVRVNTTTNTSGSPATGAPLVEDNTARTDDACRDYNLSSPHLIGGTEDISLAFGVSFPGTPGSFFSAGRATFIFQL